jgi:hypothetical protein
MAQSDRDRRLAAPMLDVLVQIAICALAVFVYFRVRGMTAAWPNVADRNAALLIKVERALGINWEYVLQQTVIGSQLATRLLNWIYIFGHWPVIVVTLVWLFFGHRAVFRRTRNAMFASGAVGLVVFAVFPVAPPRLYELGLIDTVADQSHAYRIFQPVAFTNQYAAMPSLHVGWDLLIGLAIWTAARRRWVRLLGLAMPVAMAAAVVLTANHYLLDAVVGATLTSLAWIVCGHRFRIWPWQRRTSDDVEASSRAPAEPVAEPLVRPAIHPVTRTDTVIQLPRDAPIPAGAPAAPSQRNSHHDEVSRKPTG